MRQIEPYGSRAGFLPKHYVYGIILHGRIEHLFHLTVEPVYLIYEQYVPRLKIIEYCGYLTGLFYGWPAGDLHIHAHLSGNDAGKSSLAESRRPVKQHMVHGFIPGLCRAYIHLHLFPDVILAYIFIKALRP